MGNEIYQVCSCKDSIENYKKESEKIITKFINENDKKNHTYSLVEKANMPLLIW